MLMPHRACLFVVFAVGMSALPGCETDGTFTSAKAVDAVVDSALALRVPDLALHPELDPLTVTQDGVGLKAFMSDDSVALVLDNLQAYFHDQNIGNWDGLFARYPLHMHNDTAMMNAQRGMMEKWFYAGLRNRTGGVHLRYISPWIQEERQRVALLGMDLNFYLDFFENFEGNPEGMRLSLQDQYGKDALAFNEFDQLVDGDTSNIRQWEVNAETIMYALWANDSTYCTFVPGVFDRGNFGHLIMAPETKLALLRHKRTHVDKP